MLTHGHETTQNPRSLRQVKDGKSELTIDRLARKTGMTARNIRAHQSRGLLPPPDVRGRVGYYGPEHVARLQLIKEMQADGFNLEAISNLLGGSGSGEEMLRFRRALREPFAEERPRVVTVEELAAPFEGLDPDQLQQMLSNALEIGFLHPLGDDRFEELSPRLAAVRSELFELGISPEAAIDVGTVIRKHSDAIAKEFANLFLEADLGAVRQGRPPRQGVADGAREARAHQAAGERGGPRDLRARDGRRRREGHGAGAGPDAG